MERKEKIRLLKAIREGLHDASVLHEPILYNVLYNMSLDGLYTVSEMRINPRPNLILNKDEFEAWKQKIEAQNKNRSQPHRINIVEFKATPNCTNMFHCRKLPNCLEGCKCEKKAY